MKTPRRRRLRALRPVAAVVLAAAALSGCSIAGTAFHPGVAATVGSRTVTSSEVDRLARGACGALSDQLEQSGQVLPLSSFKTGVLRSLVISDAAEQLGLEHDVRPSATYRTAVATTRAAATGLSGDELDALVVVQNTGDLVDDLLTRVGTAIATERSATAQPTPQQAYSTGADALVTWIKDHDIDIDPVYDTELGSFSTPEGQAFVRSIDTAVSYGVSALARSGEADQPDQAATAALPASQRCGKAGA